MTDRIHGFAITLDRDIRDDDVEPILQAIRMIRHVVDVEPIVATLDTHLARTRVRMDLQSKIYDALAEVLKA